MQESNFIARKKELLAVLDDFARVQDEQRQSGVGQGLPKLMEWRGKRARAFGCLKQSLDSILENCPIGYDDDFMGVLRQRIQTLLEGEQALARDARNVRSMLATKLGELRNGKKALQGYSVNHGAGPQPRFLSSRT